MKQTICSVGDTIFQSDTTLHCMPDDFREKYGLPQGLSVKEQIEARTIYTYLCDRNRQFGTALGLNGNVMEVALT